MAEPTAASPRPPIRGLTLGLAGWLGVGIALVALRGVQWDENYEFAQALIGDVPYPAWHPLVYWVHHLYTAQLYLTAALMEVFHTPTVPNATRNVLFVWATVLPPYLLGAALARNALAGHVTAVLMLSGVAIDFDASYPQFLLPGMFSNGHVGTGFALIVVATLALGRPVLAFFLIGLMPAVHIGQTPQLMLFAGMLYLIRFAYRQPAAHWRRMDTALAAGLATSTIVLAAGYFAWRAPDLPALPAASAEDTRAIWAGWVGYHDMHRRPPGILAILLTAAFVFMAYCTMLGLGYAKNRERYAWPLTIAYAALTLLVVLGIMLVQTVLGFDMPPALLSWLPYRLWNHMPPILVAALVACLFEKNARNSAPTLCLIIALAGLAALPALQIIAPPDVAFRYLRYTGPVLFFLLGAVFTLVVPAMPKPARTVGSLSGIALLLLTAIIHQFGAACAAGGALVILIGRRIPEGALVRYRSEILGALIAVIVVRFGATEFIHRNPLPVGEFEQAAAQYLRERGEADALLASPMGQVLLQAQTGHPVLEDLATPFCIGYRPPMGPMINTMYRDVYGVDFRYPTPGKFWQQIWTERPAAEWKRVGQQYSFRYVVAPEGLSLHLTPVVEHNGRTLYQIQ